MSSSHLADKLASLLRQNPELSIPFATILVLTSVVKDSNASTTSELTNELELAVQELLSSTSSISASAGCGLFMRFVTRTLMEVQDLAQCRDRIIERGQQFQERALEDRQRVARLGAQFIQDDMVLLTHSYSRMVIALLLQAALSNKRFTVYITESYPSGSGYWAARKLTEAGIAVQVVLDCAVAVIIDKVDFVLVGAEGVVENGGIINQVGTAQLALVAKAANKPFYVTTESSKFVRTFPLNQADLQRSPSVIIASDGSNLRYVTDTVKGDAPPIPESVTKAFKRITPDVDYTSPDHITLLFTDLGVLTPSAVSDELIRLYA